MSKIETLNMSQHKQPAAQIIINDISHNYI